MGRRLNGDGTIFKRKDGRWSAQAYVTLVNGAQKRICITAKTREIVRQKLSKILDQERQRVAYVEKDWTVSEYIDYWLQNVQSKRVRMTTILTYRQISEKYIKPTLGRHRLKDLHMRHVRGALDTLREQGCGGATLQKFYQVLSTCMNCAMREELVFRNVVTLVEKPRYTAKETSIWTAEQAAHFLQNVTDHPLYIAFLLLLTYGMRRGEVLGLRWCDIDFDSDAIHIRQQVGRINGQIIARDVKTTNSRRTLPLMENVRKALLEHAKKKGISIPPFNPHFEISTQGMVVASNTGTPIEPGNLIRCFDLLTKKAGLPRIKVHAMRHTAATVLKDLNVPVKDAQLILGHANISTTLNIYQHGTFESHRTAISAIEERLLAGNKITA